MVMISRLLGTLDQIAMM